MPSAAAPAGRARPPTLARLDRTLGESPAGRSSGAIQKSLTIRNLPATPLPESVIRYREELRRSARNRASGPSSESSASVQLFTAQWCGYCRKAKAYLAEKRIPYQEHDIDTSDGQRAFAQAGSGSGIPLLRWKGKQMQGFSKAAYDSLFAD